jgi:cytochrome c
MKGAGMRGIQMVVAAAVLAVVAVAAVVFMLDRKPTPAAIPTASPPASAVIGAEERIAAALVALAAAGPAEVTPANRREFYLQCRPCHSVTQPDGTVILQGSGLGPDLYGIIDRPAARQEGFAYSDSMREAGAKGLVWTVENILRYSFNPKRFLRDYTGDPKAEGTMVYSLTKAHAPLITYLRAVGPQP